jgi:hypothetical protein
MVCLLATVTFPLASMLNGSVVRYIGIVRITATPFNVSFV